MKRTILLSAFAVCSLLVNSCREKVKQEPIVAAAVVSTPDMSQIKNDIQAIENKWAEGINAKDINTLVDLYADDAISMPGGEPMQVGKNAIRKGIEKDFATPPTFSSIAFETMDVYAAGDVVTEVGKTIFKDATKKVTGAGKYIAVFEKRDGKYLCIRDISNKDSK